MQQDFQFRHNLREIVMNQDHERYDFGFDTLLQKKVKQEILHASETISM
jgi:hypothetical protein